MAKFTATKNQFFLSLSLLFISNMVNGQQNAHSIEVNLQQSMSAFSADNHPLQGTAHGGEVVFHYNVNRNKRKWSSDLGISSIDAVFNYRRMHNVTLKSAPVKGEFGDSYAFLAGVTLPVFKIKKASLALAPAFGVVYAEESWFSNQNPLVGSRLNFGMKAAVKLNVPVSEKSAIGANLDLLHYSNGGARVPNNGMNLVNVGLSYTHSLADKAVSSSAVKEVDERKHTFDIAAGFGKRGAYQSRENFYRATLYVGYNYRLKSYLALSAGVDAVYYYDLFDPNRFAETYQSNASSFKRWRVGTAVGPDFWLGKIAVMLKYGYYVYYDSLKPIDTYWTGGVKYKLTNNFALQGKIYIHKTEADFIGFGLMFTK